LFADSRKPAVPPWAWLSTLCSGGVKMAL